MTKRESKAHRRRRVIRNRIFLGLIIVAVIMVVVLIIVLASQNKKETASAGDSATQSAEVDTTEYIDDTSTSVQEQTQTADAGLVDTTAPLLTVPTNIYISLGDTVAYKSYVSMSDDIDPAPMLTIDNSNVDLSQEGDYIVIYKAIDASGNTTTKQVTLTVGPRNTDPVSEDVIYAAADNIISQITNNSMSDLDKIFAVFNYIQDNYSYTPDDVHLEYKQEAYQFMQTLKDSCYANVCLARLLLERMGYQSQMLQGEMGYIDEYHYWNLVSIDGGNTWYFFDSAWWTWMSDEYPLCMVSGPTADAISARHGDIYIYNKDDYPGIATEDIYNPEERGYTSVYAD